MVKATSWKAAFSLTTALTLAACGGGQEESVQTAESAQEIEKAQAVLNDVDASIWPVFKVKELQTLSNSPSEPQAMNNWGRVIGYEYSEETGEQRSLIFGIPPHAATDLNVLTGHLVTPSAINDRSQIIGTSNDAPFLFNPANGSMYDLTDPTGQIRGTPLALNNRGQVIGYFQTQAVLFGPPGGSGVALVALPGSVGSLAFDINNRSQIVGRSDFDAGLRWQATLFSAYGGPAKDLGKLPNGYESLALAVSDTGQAVGFTTYRGVSPGCLFDVRRATLFYTSGGKPLKIDTISNEPAPCSAFSLANAINNLGQVVGLVGNAGISTKPQSSHGFLWQKGVMRRLDSLLKPGSGWHIQEAIDINDAGQIAAIGIEKATGRKRALLLVPTSSLMR